MYKKMFSSNKNKCDKLDTYIKIFNACVDTKFYNTNKNSSSNLSKEHKMCDNILVKIVPYIEKCILVNESTSEK